MNILRKKENLDLMCNILEIMGEDSDLVNENQIDYKSKYL